MSEGQAANWKMLEKFGLYGVLCYLVVTNSIATNNSNTQFFQTRFIESVESCAAALQAAAAEMKRKDDVIEDNTKAMEQIATQMNTLSERVQRLLTRRWEDVGAESRPPFVATPVSVQQ